MSKYSVMVLDAGIVRQVGGLMKYRGLKLGIYIRWNKLDRFSY